MRMRGALLGLLLALAPGLVHAQLPPASGIVINQTPVTGGSAGQCLFINNQQISSEACGGSPSGAAGGALAGTYPNPTLASTIAGAGPTGSATVVPIITYNAAGQLTTVTSATIAPAIGSITGLGANVATALGNALNGSAGLVGFSGNIGAASGTSLSLSDTTVSSGSYSSDTFTLNRNSSGAGGIFSTATMNFTDGASQAAVSNQIFRMVYTGNNAAASSVYDTLIDLNMTFNQSYAANSFFGVNVNGPTVASGKTVTGFKAIHVGAPGGAGTTTSPSAIVIDSGSGPVLQNDSTASSSKTTGALQVAGGVGVQGHIFTDTLSVITLANTATTSAVCYNTGTGLFTYDGTLGTCTVSDERLKNIGPRIDHALDKLLQINGVNYTWKDAAYGSGPQIGVGAQTVEKVFPELVSTDSNGTKSVDYQRLTAPIIEAMRELKADNDNLRACQQRWLCRLFGVGAS